MDETRPARRSSGIYDATYGSTRSLASNASLRAHAAAPAGIPVGEANLDSGRDDQAPPQPPTAPHVPFYKRRWFIIAQIILAPIGIAMIFILLFPVVRAIVQLIVNRSQLDIQTATISNPTNDSFTLDIVGNVFHTSPIHATIRFTEPINVAWVQDGNVTQIGTMELHDTLKSRHSRAFLNQTTTFHITDAAAFGRFSEYLITSPNFTWVLESHNLRINAVKFPVAKGIHFKKYITLNGLNGFDGDVVLRDLQLPNDNPAGGINFVTVTELTNRSPFTLNLGTIVFRLLYRDVPLGLGTGKNVKITNGTNSLSLSGFLVRHDDPTQMAIISELFTNYLNGDTSPVLAIGQSTLQDDGTVISWLSSGLQALKLSVPFKAFTPIDPIKTITIGDLGLVFSAQNPWSPSAESNSVHATLKLPFGFSVSVGQIRNDFNISKDDVVVAGLSTPLGASRASVSVLGPTDTEGTINITIANTSLSVPDAQHAAFSSFNADLTNSSAADFRLIGNARAIANTSLGPITLDPIKVNVPTTLKGLNGLRGLVKIDGVDVSGGSTEAINLNINVAIYNPSNLKLSTGDLNLQLLRNGALIGTTTMRNLSLNIGNNSVLASSTFDPNKSPEGLQTLNDFVSHKDVQLTISGFDGSTNIASLVEAFKTLNINVTLPGLKTNLLDTAALTVLPTTGQNNISHVSVSLTNPFSADLHITHIKSNVSSFGIPLGVIDTAVDFHVSGRSTTKSPPLDLALNLDPSALFTLTRNLAVEANLNVEPLDAIVKLGGYQYLSPVSGPPSKRQSSLFRGFDLPSFVQTAFKHLKSDVQITTNLAIGDYQTTLEFSQSAIPTATDSSLNILLPILARPIVQRIVGGSTLGIDNVLIMDPKQTSFNTKLKGSIGNAGPFDAVISFPSGFTVSWAGQPIGNIQMNDVHVVGDVGASIDTESIFTVTSVPHLTDFTKTLLSEQSFEWEIQGENLEVKALGISVPGISLSSKQVTLKGFNGLKGGVQVQSFDLPSNDPAGGIHLTLDVKTTNPSQVGIQLSSISFNTFVGDIMIAPVASVGQVELAPVSTTVLALRGRLIPQETPAGLAAVSGVFNNFIHGIDSNVVVQGAGAGSSEVTWLNDGIKTLRIETILPNQGALKIIKSIALNQMTLLFTDATAYMPSTSSNSTDAAFQIPFGFPIDIAALEQTLIVGFEGSSIAELKIPKGPSVTDVQKRIVHLKFNAIPFSVFGDQHPAFDHFLASTTVGKEQQIHISGSANADTRTAVGLLSLENITFAVDTTISGLQGLDVVPPRVTHLDVNHGYPDFLLIKVDSSLFNPSMLTIGTNDVSFSLQFQEQTIGSANLKNLVIIPGNVTYPIDVHYAPQGGAVSAGHVLLQDFLQGIDTETTIAGTRDSTPIESLKDALSEIRLSPVTIPALRQNLVKSASLTFPVDIVNTGIASSSFTLVNPFTASINMLKVGATAQYHNLTLGTINNVDISANPLRAPGHSTVTSPALPIKFNLDPLTIIKVLTIASKEKNIDLGPLTELFKIVIDNPNFHPPVVTHVDTHAPTCVSGHQFDVADTILKTLSGLLVDLGIQTSVKLDDYPTDLSFQQKGVPAKVDKTALYLIGAVAGPIAQHLVDQAILSFSSAEVTNISDNGFDISLVGSLTNVGPLDALITFIEPLTVSWNGQDIAQITLDPICAAANEGVPNYRSKAKLAITDNTKFTSFATFLLHNPSFEWTISTKKLRLDALGTIFDNVSLSKTVSFRAFNGLPGVSVNNFNLPSDDPAGGIHIETDAIIPSPAQLGIELGSVTFESFYQKTFIGPLAAKNLSLAPKSVTVSHLSGRIVPQTGSDLSTIGQLFSNFLAGQNSTLLTRGNTVTPPGASEPVKWLSDAFKTLELPVILPGKHFNIIQSIELDDLGVIIQSQQQAFAPPTSSNRTLAKYKNPFGFSLQVVESGQTIILGSQGTNIAQLVIPRMPVNGGVSTGNVADLLISFRDLPLTSLNNNAFQQMFAGVTLRDAVDLNLRGTANVSARTSIGDVPISGIPFDVTSHLKAINAFNHEVSLNNVSVAGSGGQGGNQYIVSPVTTKLQNPSNVSLTTNDIALPVTYQGVKIGRAAINTFELIPGENIVATEFHYQPDNANDTIAQSFLTRFIQTQGDIPLTIDGDNLSSPYESLQPALAGLHIPTSLRALNYPDLIKHVNVYITTETFITNRVSIDFDLHNPLDAGMVIEFVQADAGVNGETYAEFSHQFTGFVVPPGTTVNSGNIPDVLLTKGAPASLGIVPLNYLDVSSANTVRVGGKDGYQIPWLQLKQSRVPTSYQLPGNVTLGLDKLPTVTLTSGASSVAKATTIVNPGSATDVAPVLSIATAA
ncbi:hypothetical protein AX17_005753 [Amanita inopinata Kibby_2008]|nr:hypothetical protein AX17_005753 [Amanita inopinata Kibby_2008]